MRVFRDARRKGGGALAPPGGSWRPSGRPKARERPGGARQERPLQKCVVTHFAARGPRKPLKPWGCAAVGAPGVLWNLGDAF